MASYSGKGAPFNGSIYVCNLPPGTNEIMLAEYFGTIGLLKSTERDFVLKLSALEIYNETVIDLLNRESGPLRLLDDPEKGTIVEKLNEEVVQDSQHLRHLISVCEAQRQVGETSLNDKSSRSHQIIKLGHKRYVPNMISGASQAD